MRLRVAIGLALVAVLSLIVLRESLINKVPISFCTETRTCDPLGRTAITLVAFAVLWSLAIEGEYRAGRLIRIATAGAFVLVNGTVAELLLSPSGPSNSMPWDQRGSHPLVVAATILATATLPKHYLNPDPPTRLGVERPFSDVRLSRLFWLEGKRPGPVQARVEARSSCDLAICAGGRGARRPLPRECSGH